MDINGLGHITTEEMKEEILNLRQSLVKAVQNAECREGKKDEEIERLRKSLIEISCYEGVTFDGSEIAKQALKDK